MIAASRPVQRPRDARLLAADRDGRLRHLRREALLSLLRPGDVLVANDAATLPASLHGTHAATGKAIEVRLAARDSLAPRSIAHVSAVVFGHGSFRERTEDRALPPPLIAGDLLLLGPLRARVVRTLDHPRVVALTFAGAPHEIWEGLARHGRPIQYSHIPEALALWDTWTPIAGPAVAFEPPSAGFALSWSLVTAFAARGIHFATLTHAAGLSSTGDPELDARLPLDEAYAIPVRTATLVSDAMRHNRRVVAVGTSVVRALEHAAQRAVGGVPAGAGLADNRLGAESCLHVVNTVLTGTHEPATSHHDLLRAFVTDPTLSRIDTELNHHNYRTHEFGDSMLIEASAARLSARFG